MNNVFIEKEKVSVFLNAFKVWLFNEISTLVCPLSEMVTRQFVWDEEHQPDRMGVTVFFHITKHGKIKDVTLHIYIKDALKNKHMIEYCIPVEPIKIYSEEGTKYSTCDIYTKCAILDKWDDILGVYEKYKTQCITANRIKSINAEYKEREAKSIHRN